MKTKPAPPPAADNDSQLWQRLCGKATGRVDSGHPADDIKGRKNRGNKDPAIKGSAALPFSRSRLQWARQVLQWAPELAKAVLAGGGDDVPPEGGKVGAGRGNKGQEYIPQKVVIWA